MKQHVRWIVLCVMSVGLIGCMRGPSMPEMPGGDLPPEMSDKELDALLQSLVGRTIQVGRSYEQPEESCQCIKQVRPNSTIPPVVECPNPPCFSVESERDFRDGIKVLETAFEAYKRAGRLEVRRPG
jgi:hypothetical protein